VVSTLHQFLKVCWGRNSMWIFHDWQLSLHFRMLSNRLIIWLNTLIWL